MENKNEVMAMSNDLAGINLLEQFKNPDNMFYCSIAMDGKRETKKAVYNAIQNATDRCENHINKTIDIVNVIAHPVELADDETGEIITAVRTVLIAKDGKSYEAVSGGIANAISRIMSIMGSPEGGEWEKEPVKAMIVQKPTRNGNNKILSLELV